MFAAHNPGSDMESIRIVFLLGAAGMVFFWRTMIKLLAVAVIVLVGWSVIAFLAIVR